jgi:hypothetical protein
MIVNFKFFRGVNTMFGNLFSSKNKQLVKKWQKEHEKIVELAHKVIAEYTKNNHKTTKKVLKSLNALAVDHVMNEDIEFYKLMRDDKRIDKDTELLVNDFTKSFKQTKLTLMSFLSNYSKPETELDNSFFKTFTELVDVLGQRIDFEEKNLYSKLNEK